MAHQRQVDVEQVLRLLGLAGGEQLVDLHQHLGPGEARHGAVGAAPHLLRQVEPAIADQDRDAAPAGLLLALAHARELGEAGRILVLQHDELPEVVDQALEHRRREIDARGLRIVLVDDGDVRPERLEELRIVIVDAVIALEPGRRRHHHARGARDHDLVRQAPDVLEPGVTDAHDDLPALGAADHAVHHRQSTRQA